MARASPERVVGDVATNAHTFHNTYDELLVSEQWRVDCM